MALGEHRGHGAATRTSRRCRRGSLSLMEERKSSSAICRRCARARNGRRCGGSDGAAGAPVGVADIGDIKLTARAVEGHRDEGSQEPRRPRQEAARLRRGAIIGVTGTEGRRGGRRHLLTSPRARQRGRSGARRLRGSAGRQGRRWAARHGAGRRARWRQGYAALRRSRRRWPRIVPSAGRSLEEHQIPAVEGAHT